MAEKPNYSVKEIAKKTEGTWDLGSLSINLAGEDKKVVDFFSKLEGKMFPNNSSRLSEEVKSDAFVEILTESTHLLLERMSAIDQKLQQFKKKQQLAEIEGNQVNTPLNQVEAIFKEQATLENALNALNEVASYVYGILSEFVKENQVSPESLQKLGFKEKDIDLINAEIQKWINKLEENVPEIKALKDELENLKRSPATTQTELVLAKEKLSDLYKSADSKIKELGYVGETVALIEEKYLKPISQKEIELDDEIREQESQKQRAEALKEFEERVAPLEEVIEKAPLKRADLGFNDRKDEGRYAKQLKELERIREDLVASKHKLDQERLLEDRGPNELESDKINSRIKSLQERFKAVDDRLRELVREAKEPPPEEMTIGDLARELLKDKRKDPFFWKEWKSGSTDARVDSVVNEFIRRATTPFDKKDFGTEEEWKAAELDRIVQKVRVQLGTLSNQLQWEDETASRNRKELFPELQKRILTRRELLIATTYHPEWGKQIRDILEWSFKTGSLRRGEIVVERGGKEIVLTPSKEKDKDGTMKTISAEEQMLPGETIKYKYSKKMSYEILSGERGETFLQQSIRAEERFKGYHEMAFQFAQTLFSTFDLLTISLAEMDKRTQTRGHNTTEKDIDRVWIHDPLAAAAHRAKRYGGSEQDWSLRFLVIYDDVSKSYIPLGKSETVDQKGFEHLQELAQSRVDVFYDVKKIAGKVPLGGFCEPTGLNTYDVLVLHPGEHTLSGEGEKLWRINELIDFEGEVISGGTRDQDTTFEHLRKNPNAPKKKQEEMTTADKLTEELEDVPKELEEEMGEDVQKISLYTLAEQNGLMELFELYVKDLGPKKLTEDKIMRSLEEGGQGGLLGKWFQIAGRAKMFPGRHMRNFLVPLLTDYVMRLFHQFEFQKNDHARNDLQHDVVEAIRNSRDGGGLSSYKKELTEVMNNLFEEQYEEFYEEVDPVTKKRTGRVRVVNENAKPSRDLRPHMDFRSLKREGFLKKLYQYKHHGSIPPATIGQVDVRPIADPIGTIVRSFRGRDPKDLEYLEMLQGHAALGDYISRSGTMEHLEDKTPAKKS